MKGVLLLRGNRLQSKLFVSGKISSGQARQLKRKNAHFMNKPLSIPKAFCLQPRKAPSGPFIVDISGSISLHSATEFMADIETLMNRNAPAEVTLDLSGVRYMDSAGALALKTISEKAAAKAFTVKLIRMSAETERVLGMVGRDAPPKTGRPDRSIRLFLEQVGNAGVRAFDQSVLLCLFVGDVAVSTVKACLRPGSIRWDAVLFYMKKAGMDGLPIVGLISVLLGMIMAFMASLQLRQFGANIFVASLVAIALVKELGPIMTAIIFAGRSGSAFSAEIGTMMINEEIDALSTMGFDPVRFLVLPKLIASVVVVPILTCYSALLGILGGAFVGVIGMDLTLNSYLQQTMQSIHNFDVVASLAKTACFAVLIATISCYRGFRAKGGAQAVGSVTTSAVVSSIFLIIVADSAFAIMLHYIR